MRATDWELVHGSILLVVHGSYFCCLLLIQICEKSYCEFKALIQFVFSLFGWDCWVSCGIFFWVSIISWLIFSSSLKLIYFPFKFVNRYNLFNLVDHFHSRGLYRSIFLRYPTNDIFADYGTVYCRQYFPLSYLLPYISFILICNYSIMEGEESFEQFSPEVRIKDPSVRDAISLLPPIILFHGTSDRSLPSDARLVCCSLNSYGMQFLEWMYQQYNLWNLQLSNSSLLVTIPYWYFCYGTLKGIK